MLTFIFPLCVCVCIDCTNTPESGPNSPPALGGSRGSPTSAPIQEENEDPNYQGERGCINDFSLYTSPSMPNISLGRPHLSNAHSHNNYVRIYQLHMVVENGTSINDIF